MRLLTACLLALFAAGPAVAQIDLAPKVQARLIAESGEAAPGGTFAVALEQNIRPGWHTYWINPGEAGLPTELKWSLPPGWHAGSLAWPYPRRLPVGPLMNYGYEGKVWLLTTLTAPRDAKPGDLANLKATASFLVCKEVCIPEDHDVSLPLAIARTPARPYATVAEQFAAARAKIPTAWPGRAAFQLGKSLDLFLPSKYLGRAGVKDVAFFPLTGDEIVDFAPQSFAPAAGGIVLRLVPVKHARPPPTLTGVVVLTAAAGAVRSAAVNALPGPVPQVHSPARNVPHSPTVQAGGPSLALALVFALLGGLILNVMPCVLPILAMKALAIAQRTCAIAAKRARRFCLWRRRGAELPRVGSCDRGAARRRSRRWAGAFSCRTRSRWRGFALLVFAVGLNLSGLFEVLGITAGESAGAARRHASAPSSPACWRWRWRRPAPRPSWPRRWAMR